MPDLPTIGALAFLAVVLLATAFVVVSGRRRRRRFDLDDTALERLSVAIRAAESRTSAEIVPMVIDAAEDHPDARLRAALATLATGSVLLAGLLPWSSPELVLASQIALAAIGYLAATVSRDFERLFVLPGRADSVAEEQAAIEFHERGVGRTRDGHGVLLFVAWFERRVVVLADDGIARDAGDLDWRPTRDAILSGIGQGTLSAALEAGIREAGAALSDALPADATDVDELPDRVIVEDA